MIKVCNTYTLNDLPLGTKGRVIALGMFDGLHMGHLDIIRKAVAVAERDGLTSTVQTFKNLFKQSVLTEITSVLRISGKALDIQFIILKYHLSDPLRLTELFCLIQFSFGKRT